jgi:hypothetical protein
VNWRSYHEAGTLTGEGRGGQDVDEVQGHGRDIPSGRKQQLFVTISRPVDDERHRESLPGKPFAPVPVEHIFSLCRHFYVDYLLENK